jgi:hypothetical protein
MFIAVGLNKLTQIYAVGPRPIPRYPSLPLDTLGAGARGRPAPSPRFARASAGAGKRLHRKPLGVSYQGKDRHELVRRESHIYPTFIVF